MTLIGIGKTFLNRTRLTGTKINNQQIEPQETEKLLHDKYHDLDKAAVESIEKDFFFLPITYPIKH